MKTVNAIVTRFLEDRFEGSLKNAESDLDQCIRYFSTHIEFPETELDHHEFKRSLTSLYDLKDLLNRMSIEE